MDHPPILKPPTSKRPAAKFKNICESTGDNSFVRLEEGEQEGQRSFSLHPPEPALLPAPQSFFRLEERDGLAAFVQVKPDASGLTPGQMAFVHSAIQKGISEKHNTLAKFQRMFKYLVVVLALFFVYETKVHTDKTGALELASMYGSHYDGLELVAARHPRDMSKAVTMAMEDLQHWFDLFSDDCTFNFRSIHRPDLEKNWPKSVLVASSLNGRNAELKDEIWTMHTMPNVHLLDYSFIRGTAKISAYISVIKASNGTRISSDEDGYYEFWLHKSFGFGGEWKINKLRATFISGIPWARPGETHLQIHRLR